MSDESVMADAQARRSLKAVLQQANCRVHQADDPPLFTRDPRSPMQPWLWRHSELQSLLEQIGAEIEIGSGGQRRTLRLANPGLDYGTTPTFWASIQYILPGEIASAHRHTANAFRFIMHGTGATTTVDGERYAMEEGDLVLTPSWAWHDHEHHGDKPMIWLDVLDISLMRAMNATFFESFEGETQPVSEIPDHSERAYGSGLMRPPGDTPLPGPNPLLVYPRAMAEAALARAKGLPPDPFDDVILEYQNPLTGGPVMTTLALKSLILRAGFVGQARRHTGSKLYYVIHGSGSTLIDGVNYEWNTGDFLAIPPWALHRHSNASGQDARLFQVDDTPTLRALGYYRESPESKTSSI